MTDTTVDLTVMSDMDLRLSSQYIAREGDHNSATFKIVKQPASLDTLACRAEIETSQGKNYYLVENGEFALTQDISKPGPGRMQLVYSDGTEVMRKTSVAHFTVYPSINAVDEGSADFQDGLAQLQQAAFCRVDVSTGIVRFYNINGLQVGQIQIPGSVEDLDNIYVRLDGMNLITGTLRFQSQDNGIIFNVNGGAPILYADATGLRFRRGYLNQPITIENSDGSALSRSNIVTEATGDLRYVTMTDADVLFVRKTGDVMLGQLIMPTGGGVTNAQLAFGDNATGFFRQGSTLVLTVGGQIYAQWLGSPASLMMAVPLNMALQQITSLADPVGPTDAVNLRSVDSRIAAIPTPLRPNMRAYIPTEITLTSQAQVCLDVNFPVADNTAKTLMVMCDFYFDGGVAGQFYDVIYSCGIAPGIEPHNAVYRVTANANSAYMRSPISFGSTLLPTDGSFRILVSARLGDPAPAQALTQVGQRANLRSYVTVMEMQN